MRLHARDARSERLCTPTCVWCPVSGASVGAAPSSRGARDGGGCYGNPTGAGDRLGLRCEETGASVPTAMLPYCGRSLLAGMVRDLQAREALHHRLTGVQVRLPQVFRVLGRRVLAAPAT